VTWGICFIASSSETPTERGRNFKKSIQRGQEIVSTKRRKTGTQTPTPDSEGRSEEQPYWSTAKRGRHEGPHGSIRVMSPVSDTLQAGRLRLRSVVWCISCTNLTVKAIFDVFYGMEVEATQ